MQEGKLLQTTMLQIIEKHRRSANQISVKVLNSLQTKLVEQAKLYQQHYLRYLSIYTEQNQAYRKELTNFRESYFNQLTQSQLLRADYKQLKQNMQESVNQGIKKIKEIQEKNKSKSENERQIFQEALSSMKRRFQQDIKTLQVSNSEKVKLNQKFHNSRVKDLDDLNKKLVEDIQSLELSTKISQDNNSVLNCRIQQLQTSIKDLEKQLDMQEQRNKNHLDEICAWQKYVYYLKK